MKNNTIDTLAKAKKWISENTLEQHGITHTSGNRIIYPEVTGYYIPTLLEWGDKERAISFARYLCQIQKEDGSWYDAYDTDPYVFDSAQILKGLISIRALLPEVDGHIVKGVDWLISNMEPNGRLMTPSKDAWGNNENFCCELIHIYCLTPIRDAGQIFNRPQYVEAAQKVLKYYMGAYREKIMNFSLLSHFHAYVMEGLYDMGEVSLCREAMQALEKYRTRKNLIPGLNNVPWICSTGLFQLALVWYKLGDKEKGDVLFDYACGLQNPSGGWYGSYPAPTVLHYFYRDNRRVPDYFPHDEISWAVKYFLDALAYKNKLEGKG